MQQVLGIITVLAILITLLILLAALPKAVRYYVTVITAIGIL